MDSLILRYRYETKMIHILSIDIGITNMGISMIHANRDYSNPSIERIDHVDITTLDKSLTPYQTNYVADQVGRFIKTYEDWFEAATHVLIEGQPLDGLLAMEQVLFFANRSKAILLRPTMMHAYYELTRKWNAIERMNAQYSTLPDGWELLTPADIAYRMRKEETVRIAWDYMDRYASCDLRERFESLERKHDVADSICFAFMYVERKGDLERIGSVGTIENIKEVEIKKNDEEYTDTKTKKRKKMEVPPPVVYYEQGIILFSRS